MPLLFLCASFSKRRVKKRHIWSLLISQELLSFFINFNSLHSQTSNLPSSNSIPKENGLMTYIRRLDGYY